MPLRHRFGRNELAAGVLASCLAAARKSVWQNMPSCSRTMSCPKRQLCFRFEYQYKVAFTTTLCQFQRETDGSRTQADQICFRGEVGVLYQHKSLQVCRETQARRVGLSRAPLGQTLETFDTGAIQGLRGPGPPWVRTAAACLFRAATPLSVDVS